jgi:hypothetical protein
VQVDLSKRYGCLAGGVNDVKTHAWFRSIDFAALRQRSIPAPHLPRVTGPGDTSNFEDYSDLLPMEHEFRLTAEQQALFSGF